MKRKPPARPDRAQRSVTRLSEEQKAYVVRRLACYDSSTEIARDLAELFGVEISLPAIDYYHPERISSLKLAACWQELFWETRKAYIAACAQASTLEQMVRVRLREDMVLLARDAGQYRAANELLDSIAKEAGKMFTSRQTLRPGAAPAFTGMRATVIREFDDCTETDHGDPGAPTIHLRVHGPKDGGELADGTDCGAGGSDPSGDDAWPGPEAPPRQKV